ncbi:MAG: ABC transporter ATP-binding protein [Ruminococcaceae bacterium]|nr:ABC transporter ATP-binding protein [Oscillospiraceae bacterium]
MSNVILTLKNISKAFDGTRVLENFNLEIKEHEFVTLLGPSGCGKTTTLRIIGGFENPDEGEVLFEGKPISKIPPNKRPFNTVFQKYSLFSHMNIYENVAFGLKIKKMKKEEIDQKVKDALKMVNLEGFEKRMPDSLSGGQQQRIAIARAIVNEPRVLLFDEPLGALDLKLRQEMQFELKNLQRKLGITFLYVTHDQEEALTMSDTIVVMSEGVIQQLGSPVDIYNEPENAFVARFIGESNIIDGIMLDDFKVKFADCEFVCVDKGFEENEVVDVVIRPEDIKVVPKGEGMLDVTVTSVVFKGVHYEMLLEGNGFTWLVQSTKAQQEGEDVSINIFPDDIHIMHKSNK